jgi:hypothetical protein
MVPPFSHALTLFLPENLAMIRYLPSVTIVLLLTPISHAQAQAPKESLRGLSGVYINVLEIDAEVEKAGVTTRQVKEKVEAQLRKAGITIHREPQLADGDANLTIIVDTVKHPQGVFVFKVGVSLAQRVRLTRDPKGRAFPSETWSAISLGLTTPKRLDIIYEPLQEKLDQFIKDYHAVNTKKK